MATAATSQGLPNVSSTQINAALKRIRQIDPTRAQQLNNQLAAMTSREKYLALAHAIIKESQTSAEQPETPRPVASVYSGWDVRKAPIRAADMEPAGVVLRYVAGLAFVAYSIIATAIVIGGFLSPIVTLSWKIVSLSVFIGTLIGVGVTLGEWGTAEKMPRTHWFLVLVCDAPFSAIQTYVWLMVIAVANWGDAPSWSDSGFWWHIGVAYPGTIVLAVAIAKWQQWGWFARIGALLGASIFFILGMLDWGTFESINWQASIGVVSLLWGIITAKMGEAMLITKKESRYGTSDRFAAS